MPRARNAASREKSGRTRGWRAARPPAALRLARPEDGWFWDFPLMAAILPARPADINPFAQRSNNAPAPV